MHSYLRVQTVSVSEEERQLSNQSSLDIGSGRPWHDNPTFDWLHLAEERAGSSGANIRRVHTISQPLDLSTEGRIESLRRLVAN